MLYEWLGPLGEEFQLFNLFNYITFRVGGALMTSLIIFFIFGEKMINALRARQGKGQPIREDGPESQIIKQAGPPTIGRVDDYTGSRHFNLALGGLT
jgi:phospho-N-acetylmuramoyl-pentapeptide-transferase